MDEWMLRAPWWKLAVAMGLLLAPFAVLLFRLTGDHSWPAAALMGVAGTVVCAPVLGFLTATTIQDSTAGAGQLPEHERAVVERAARRGPAPEDAGQREAALRLVEDRLLGLRATRTRALTSAAVLLVVSGFLAVARSPWWWLAAAACAALLVVVLAAPARLARRAELLRAGD
ncbi:hypothetical protein [Blastococcus sp. VKM Ac-2987]|uniref:hypothetical protein n=1 Tax=Blastococcus sp. VKM Ac-2987 TaxID=3004141 RepID=UPI0022AB6E9D|nr:hypothetical protein [Blastococcus sp. VKM Ac-2987]MCZ2857664.1 hypothetical protein [Blastococcus sp. VKM Ac-2987]